MAQAAYVFRIISDLGVGGSAMDGNILRRKITMGEPQHMHSSCGRGATGVGALGDSLNTNNFSSAIKRLLLGCKNP